MALKFWKASRWEKKSWSPKLTSTRCVNCRRKWNKRSRAVAWRAGVQVREWAEAEAVEAEEAAAGRQALVAGGANAV